VQDEVPMQPMKAIVGFLEVELLCAVPEEELEPQAATPSTSPVQANRQPKRVAKEVFIASPRFPVLTPSPGRLLPSRI
jgi:hypothetical protein